MNTLYDCEQSIGGDVLWPLLIGTIIMRSRDSCLTKRGPMNAADAQWILSRMRERREEYAEAIEYAQRTGTRLILWGSGHSDSDEESDDCGPPTTTLSPDGSSAATTMVSTSNVTDSVATAPSVTITTTSTTTDAHADET